jgi:hypothetical protein
MGCPNPTFREVGGRHWHSRKWDLGVLLDSRKLKTRLQGSKHLTLKCFLYCWKGFEVKMSKMASHEPFGHLQHKLLSKEGSGVKLAVWLPTTKSRESTQSRCAKVKFDTPLENSQRGRFKPCPNRRSEREVMNAQSPGSLNRDSFETPLWESRDKKPFGRERDGATQRILYGGRWWLPPSPGHGESNESKVARGLSEHQKGVEWVITNLCFVLDAGPSK